jgi:hypothetical protein
MFLISPDGGRWVDCQDHPGMLDTMPPLASRLHVGVQSLEADCARWLAALPGPQVLERIRLPRRVRW